jgi:carboxymethylenebutenolidase
VNDLITETVEFDSTVPERSPLPGYLAQPDDALMYPGIVVVQEWWGMNDHIKDVVRRFAAEGFVALAPDLYRGEVATEPDDARRLRMQLEFEDARKDIQGAVNYLVSLPQVQPKKIGLIGFCFGGAIAISMSYQAENLGAIVVFYGGGTEFNDKLAQKVVAPLLGIYGEADQGIPLEQIRANEAALQKAGKTAEFHIYPNAPHAFFNDTRPHIYDAAAAEDAWKRTLDWFRQHLS